MGRDKVQTIQEWPTPKSVKEVQAFLGFANLYRRFIPDYSQVALPLIALTKKGQNFVWTSQADDAFTELQSKCIHR